MRSGKLLSTVAICASLALVAGCSQEQAPADHAVADAASEAAASPSAARTEAGEAASDSGAPGLTTSAAPGVAFAYRYAFSLPGEAISDVQHAHAAACEELGPDKCQVTGMDYRVDAGSVTARIDFLVAPQIAHRFGKDALETVRGADGNLDDADVTGENVGGQIEGSQVRSAGMEGELARIEKRLATPGLSPQERTSLAARADELRASLRTEADIRAQGEKRLATTPMNFTYASKGLFAASDDPLGNAAASSLDSMESMLAVVLTLLGILAPWFLLAGLLFLAWKGLRRTASPAATTDASGPPA